MKWPARLAFLAAVLGLLWFGFSLRQKATDNHFLFAGSDSYGYLQLADELLDHHRYALGPVQPLHWARPPVFPLYLALVKGHAQAKMSGGEGWHRIVCANIALDLVGTGLVLFGLAYALAGPLAALLALAFVMVSPFSLFAVPAALTETLATFLLTAAVATAIPPALGSRRLGWLVASGALLALAVLTRPDSLLVAPALGLAVLGAARATPGDVRRALLRPALAIGLGFLVVYAPWPIRNLVAFGQAHPLGGRIDRYSRPVEHYQGSWAFLRAISRDWRPMTRLTTCYYDLACPVTVADFFQADPSIDERETEELTRLLALRKSQGHSPAVSDGFAALADARRRARPLEVEVLLPLRRWWAMWVADHDEYVPPYAPLRTLLPRMRGISRALVIAALAGAVVLLFDRRRRLAALILLGATVGRTAILAYTFYSMPRYSWESVPSALALVACGIVVAAGWALPRARSRMKSISGVESASMKT